MTTSAPDPVELRLEAERSAAQTILNIHIQDRVFVVAPHNVPRAVKDRFQLETGRSVEKVLADRYNVLGEIQLILFCFLAEIVANPRSSWDEFLEEFPSGADLKEGDVRVLWTEPVGDDPEA